MKRIGILSDTHGFLHPRLKSVFRDCDEIWHAGDIGNAGILLELNKLKPVRAVFGNIDGQEIRNTCKEYELFTIENLKVLMMHIGGYPGRYTNQAKELITKEKPDLFVCGHSHILKVMPDKSYKLLHINPGAGGKFGSHQVITMVRLEIEDGEFKNLEVVELPKKS